MRRHPYPDRSLASGDDESESLGASPKQREVEAVCNPIITKLYGAAGGAPGGPDMGGMGGAAGGAPGAGAGGQGGAGPTIEEVD